MQTNGISPVVELDVGTGNDGRKGSGLGCFA